MSTNNSTTPICRCRVLYLGSAVPHITKDGLQGIQEPLRDLYPEQGPFSAKGIDSWLSVWSNGLLLENVDESLRQVTRFFSIETLHYCAAVRYVVVPGNNGEKVEKFLPLDSPFARHANPNHPPLFACILRRTSGIKVLECHAFICKKEAAANALVRCCFHSYADSMQAKHLEENPYYIENRRSRSMTGLNTLEKVEVWRSNTDVSQPVTNGSVIHGSTGGPPPPPRSTMGSSTLLQSRNGDQEDDNYKIWTGNAPTERELLYVDSSGTMRSLKSGSATTRSAQVKTRQMIGPTSRPPPPPSPSILNGKEPKGKSSKLSKPKNKKKQKDLPPIPNGSGRMMNGFRPASVIGHFQAPASVYGGSGLYTERRVKRPGRPPIPGHEEPIYIPSTRPLSPVSSYQPAGFPYEQYFMQYGTAPRNRPSKGEKKIRQPQYMPQHYYQPPQQVEPPQERIPPEDKEGSDDKDMDSSPFNTGIYKKKGHLNERAFSYSIRQEHRSRSNSLANLNFFANGDADVAGPSGERTRDDDRKERELAQLVSGLDLKENGDVASMHHGPETNFIRRKAPPYQR